MSNERDPAPKDDDEARAWERLDGNDERDDAVIAADDTGLLKNEAAITIATTEEELGPDGGLSED
jgi:hypothetical protein